MSMLPENTGIILPVKFMAQTSDDKLNTFNSQTEDSLKTNKFRKIHNLTYAFVLSSRFKFLA